MSWARDGALKGVTHKRMSAQSTCRVPRPRCTKCTKTSLGFLVVQLSPREPKKCYGLIRYNHTRLKHERTKRGTRDSPSFDPLTMANDVNWRNGIKRVINSKQAKGSIHILLDRRGLRTKGERRMESTLLRPIRHGTDEGWKKRVIVPRSKPTRRASRLSLRPIAMRLSILEPKERDGQGGTSIRGG
jgi:hypothetical protein